LNAEEKSTQAIFSIVISALTTGMVSATISFDFDVDPMKRRETPDFYGYIPDGLSRTLIFACMVMNSALLLLTRSVGSALLMLADRRFLLWFYAADMGIYFAQKVLRGDFHYWAPVEGAAGNFISVLMRVGIKAVTDHTGIVQFRHPGELGGAYWTANMVLAILIFPFVAIKIYYGGIKSEDTPQVYVMKEETAWTLVAYLCCAWLFSFCFFLKLMKKTFRGTFFSTKLGKQVTMDYFLMDEDANKAIVFTSNRKQWSAIEGDVKDWVQSNWERWEDEQPDWFTEAWKSNIDDDWLSAEELKRQNIAGGGQRRRSSLLGGLQPEGGRERRGSATVVPAVVVSAEDEAEE
jgi:hypothetical protein